MPTDLQMYAFLCVYMHARARAREEASVPTPKPHRERLNPNITPLHTRANTRLRLPYYLCRAGAVGPNSNALLRSLRGLMQAPRVLAVTLFFDYTWFRVQIS
jgi:hypothetical protein